MHELMYAKDGHTYVLKFRKEDRDEAVAQLCKWVNNRNLNFNWFDATLLRKKINEHCF